MFFDTCLQSRKRLFRSIFEDVTELKKQESKIKSLSKFPSENPLPVLRIDGKGIILYGNIAALLVDRMECQDWRMCTEKHKPTCG